MTGKSFLPLFIIGIIMLSGCKPAAPSNLDRIGKAAMGEVHKPRNGEGELFTIDTETGRCRRAERVDLHDETTAQR